MFLKLGYRLYRRRNLVAVLGLVFVLLAAGWGGKVQDKLSVARDSFDAPHSESVVTEDALARASGASPQPDFVAVVRNPRGIDSADGRAQVSRVIEIVGAQRNVARVAAPFGSDAALRTPISRDGRVSFVAAYFKPIDGTTAQEDAKALKVSLDRVAGVSSGGSLLVYAQVNDQVKDDAKLAELLAFPILFLLTFVFFRGAVAAALPLVIAAVAIVGAFAVLRTVTEFTSLSVFAVNLVTGLGLGLAIDYSLFMVNRFREELAAGRPPDEALARTVASAGKTVAFSSAAVALAFISLLLFPQQAIRSMGIGGIAVAVLSGVAALTVLPAVLAKLGPRVNALAPARMQRATERSARGDEQGLWYRLASLVMRRPLVVALSTAAVLIAVGLPALGVHFGRADATVLPSSASARQVSEQLNAAFGENASAPIIVAVNGPAGAGRQVDALAGSVRELPGVEAVQSVHVGSGLWQLNVLSSGNAVSSAAQETVRSLRSLSAPGLALSVGGEPARYIDQQASIGHRLPLALLLLVLSTSIVLLVMTRSLVLPIKALLMNLLTLSATFGILVLVFQDARFEGLLGYTSSGALEPATMVLLFIVAFALTTDYGVFLLTRIKEARDGGMPDKEAVAFGLERTGRIVSAAALLMCVALGTFMVSQVEYIKELGLGLVCAIAIDALLVRPLLVPALMTLLGAWNWWAPPRLRARREQLAAEPTLSGD